MNPGTHILWNSTEAAVITGGRASRPWVAGGVSMSLEDLRPGDLYIATQEDDLSLVFARGAAAAVVPQGMALRGEWPVLEVPNVYQALQDLGRAARFRSHAHVIAVQGRADRRIVSGALSENAYVHQAGRHLSLSLAQMPEDCCFGVFGLSPAVKPDIAVITDSTQESAAAIFESMSSTGAVILNADSADYLELIARARAAGLKSVYTYGAAAEADCRIENRIAAGNGVRLTAHVFDQAFTLDLGPGDAESAAVLPALMIMKLCGIRPVIGLAEQGGAALSPGNVMLARPPSQAIFRVANIVDLGPGKRTAVLDALRMDRGFSPFRLTASFSPPRRIESLNLVYAAKDVPLLSNAAGVLASRHKNAALEKIVPDVMAPGDYVIFDSRGRERKTLFSEALRLVSPSRKGQVKPSHAL